MEVKWCWLDEACRGVGGGWKLKEGKSKEMMTRRTWEVLVCPKWICSFRQLASSSNRKHLSYADCLEVRRENNLNFLCCIVYSSCARWYAHTHEQFLNLRVGLYLYFVFVCLFWFSIFLFLSFCVSIDHFIPPLLAVVMFGLVPLVPSQEIGWEERLWNNLFCVERDV